MGGRTKVHLSLWLTSILIIFCQDAEADNGVTTTSTTMPPPPMQPIVMFGANTDKDNLKGRIPWRIMPFKTDKDKYKPYIIYPPPKTMYPPQYGKPNGYVHKDWDPPKKKDDIKHKKKPKDLDDIPKSKTDQKKSMYDMMSERNSIMHFLSLPAYASRCLDGDKKFLDDKSECKTLKRQLALAGKQPAGGNNYYPQRRLPWQSNSFIDTSLYYTQPQTLQPVDYTYPNYYPLSPTPDGLTYPLGPINPYGQNGYINPLAPPVPTNPYLPPGSSNPYLPPGSTSPYVPGSSTITFTPIGPPNPYTPYQYGYLIKGSKLPPYGFPYSKFPNAYNRLFANVNTESTEENEEDAVLELVKDKPEQKEKKPTPTEVTKNVTCDQKLIQTTTLSSILP